LAHEIRRLDRILSSTLPEAAAPPHGLGVGGPFVIFGLVSLDILLRLK
jgi:hypothetical protein